MTEPSLRIPPGPPTLAAPTLRVLPDTRAAARAVAPARRPVHVAVALGVTASMYAVSLAGVTALQAGSDARLAAERAPAAAAVVALRSSHDRLEAELARIAAGLDGAAASYGRVTDDIAGHESALAMLRERVAAVEGSAAALRVPAVSRLPTISSRTVYVSARPVTNACTAASGKTC